MAESYETIKLFGCSVQNLSVQFGMNQNPTVVTVRVIKDTVNNEIFGLNRGSTRSIVDVEVGALFVRGIVQSVDEQTIDIGGSGIYTIRITDTKPVLDAGQVFLHASSDFVNLGENIISISPDRVEDLEKGVLFSKIKSVLQGKTLKYGQVTYSLNMDQVVLPSRGLVDGINIEYRVKGSSMSVLELIQQVMQDHSLDWYVTTSVQNVITIIPIDRGSRGINLSVLKTGASVIRERVGFENREDVNRSVVIGAQRQILGYVDGPRFQQFWGFDQNGVPYERPTFTIVYQNGQKVVKTVSEEEIRRVLTKQDGPETLGPDYYDALQQYGNEFWGRKFYFQITPSQIDADGEPWVDVINAGFWEESDGNRRPDGMPYDGALKFGTDDGRWVSFVKLPEPSERFSDRLKVRWDDSVRLSQNVLITERGQWYMKCSTERFDTHIVVTLPTPLVIAQNDSSNTDDEDIVIDRRTVIAKAWIPIIDKKRFYGYWSFEPKKSGKTELIIDSSINPWNFGYRDIPLSEAVSLQEQVAKARLRSITVRYHEIDTAELEVTGFPRVNVGTTVGAGTNITSITVSFSTSQVTTIYKANIYTGELSKFNRLYQDLIDSLRRKNKIYDEALYTPTNYDVVQREVSLPGKKDNSTYIEPKGSAAAEAGEGVSCVIVKRSPSLLNETQPLYDLRRVKGIIVNNGLRFVENAISIISRARNISEPDGLTGRCLPGTIVTAFRVPGSPSSYFFESPSSIPYQLSGTIQERTGDRIYRVSLTVDDLRLSEDERALLDNVENKGEPLNSPGRLTPGTNVTIDLVPNEVGVLIPTINVPSHYFGNPGEGS